MNQPNVALQSRSQLIPRMPLLLCLAYCGVLFYLKAAANSLFDIPHVDGDATYIPKALWLITASIVPAFALLVMIPIAKPAVEERISRAQVRTVVSVAISFSVAVALLALVARGGNALTDFYGNRLLVEHGLLAPVTIFMAPFIFATAIVLALSESRRAMLAILPVCLIWGVFLAKGSMLVYPLLIYLGLRHGGRRGSMILLGSMFVLSMAGVVLLGRLRSGSGVTDVFGENGLHLLLSLYLARIDQLDSFALALSHGTLEYSQSLWGEAIKSLQYLLPRDGFPDKPLSFSMEMTKNLRPAVFYSDAANNYTLFAQTYIIAGPWGPILCFLIFSTFFYSLALIQRISFGSNVGFWIFSLGVVVPCFMSLVGSGLFREYVIFQFFSSLAAVYLFRFVFRNRIVRHGRASATEAGA